MRRALSVLFPLLVTACHHAPPPNYAPLGAVAHRFDDADAWAARFEDPSRDEWQRPELVFQALALPPDAVVADVGSATGYFSVRLSKVVPKGHVYGVDIEQSMFDYLSARATREDLSNLTPVLGAPDDAKLPVPVDLVLVVNTFHHLEQRPAYFARLAASLKPGARVAIIDFRKGSHRGPPDDAKLTVEQVKAELAEAGYRFDAEWTTLPEQYFLTFKR
jgi:SAM-dependent methyltransferase